MSRILVVEDSPNQLSRIVATLYSAGFEVSSAGDWAECRAMLHGVAPDLILLDVNLAGSQGGDILALQLKKHPTLKASKVVFHSASKGPDLQVMVRRSGADGFIIKGQTEQLFLAAVRSFLVPPDKG